MGNALLTNPMAKRVLQQETGRANPHPDDPDWIRGAIKRLLSRGEMRFRMSEDAWITVPREDKRALVLHAVPVQHETESSAHTVLILVDLERNLLPSPDVLQKMFGLTPAEAKLAIEIATGETPADIAKENLVSMATVRSQLASVLAKTQTGRQAKLVALLARVAILP
jgi:DNA-binding CsgD family transcriptional regulator